MEVGGGRDTDSVRVSGGSLGNPLTCHASSKGLEPFTQLESRLISYTEAQKEKEVAEWTESFKGPGRWLSG